MTRDSKERVGISGGVSIPRGGGKVLCPAAVNAVGSWSPAVNTGLESPRGVDEQARPGKVVPTL